MQRRRVNRTIDKEVITPPPPSTIQAVEQVSNEIRFARSVVRSQVSTRHQRSTSTLVAKLYGNARVACPCNRVRARIGRSTSIRVIRRYCRRRRRVTFVISFPIRRPSDRFDYRNIAPSRLSSRCSKADETVSTTRTRLVWRLVKDTDLWPSLRKRTTFANHFIISPASQKGDTIYMKFLDTVSPSLSRARSGSCKKLIEPFIGPATRCMSSLKYQGFSFRNLLEQDIKILLQPTQEIATIQGNVTGYT